MKIAIVGAGVIGLLSAYYLHKYGYDIDIYDQEDDVAAHASSANAGQLSYSYMQPLGSPALLTKLPAALLGLSDTIKIRKMDTALLSWALKLFIHSHPYAYQENQNTLVDLAYKSRHLMQDFLSEELFDFEHAENGKLYLFDNETHRQNFAKDSPAFTALTPDECLQKEPCLKERQGVLKGGLLAEQDARGNCTLFCQKLKDYLEQQDNIHFHFQTAIKSVEKNNNKVTALISSKGKITADKYLVCTGAFPIKDFGINEPVYPIKGYSLDLPLYDQYPITHNITDHTRRIVIAPFPNALRISGLVRFDRYNDTVEKQDISLLEKTVQAVFPEMTFKDADIFCSFRPYTPSSTPIVKQTDYHNLFVNIGHGMLGWTLAHATAFSVAELIHR